MAIEENVAAHYSRPGLEAAILAALQSAGKSTDPIDQADLAGVDEFHFGWHPATVALADDLAFPAGARILDIGSGIGGPARYFAAARDVNVTGVDLTEEFVKTAESLTRRTGLAGRVDFRQASALSLPFADASFDGATMIHVGMNIADKGKVFSEARRVLKPGARFGVYEAMRGGPGPLPYPLPWAMTEATSFVETPDTYERLLRDAGFSIEARHDRTALVRETAEWMRAAAADGGPPTVSLRMLLGMLTAEQIANGMQAIGAGLIAPTEIIARAA